MKINFNESFNYFILEMYTVLRILEINVGYIYIYKCMIKY